MKNSNIITFIGLSLFLFSSSLVTGQSLLDKAKQSKNGLTPIPLLKQKMGANQGWDIQQDIRLVGDFNGDGMDDILAMKDGTTYSPYAINGVFELLTDVTKPIIKNATKNYTLAGNIFRDKPDDEEVVIIGHFKDRGSEVYGIYIQAYDGPYTAAYGFTITDDYSTKSGWDPAKHPVMMGDVNGDGHDDIIGFGQQDIFVSLSNDNREFDEAKVAIKNGNRDLCYNNGWRVETHHRLVGDINKDGHADIVAFGTSDVFVYLGDKDGRFTKTNKVAFTGLSEPPFTHNKGWISSKQPIHLGDVDGDGLLDIIGYTAKGVVVSYNQTKAGSNNISFDKATFVLQNLGTSSGWNSSKHIRTAGDIDGDGKVELIGFGANDVFILQNAIFPSKGGAKK